MIKSLTLSNWKSHRASQLGFQNGTNVLVGSMGSGKSSVLQAISFALFGTFAELKSRDLRISEVITRGSGAKSAEIELKINSLKGPMTIQRRIDGSKNSHEAKVLNEASELLAGPNPTSANDYIKDVLKVDEDVFLRTVYAMQNEVDGILRLSPGERKKRLDELMGLNRFETARKTAQTLRSRIKAEIIGAERILADLKIEDIENQESSLKKEVSDLKNKQGAITKELSLKEREEKINKDTLDKIRGEARAFESLSERIRSKEAQISDITMRLAGVELNQTQEQVKIRIKEIQEELDKLGERKSVISKSLSEKNSSLVGLEREVAVLETKARDALQRLGEFQKIEIEIESLKSKHGISDLNAEIIKIKSEIESKDEQVKINLAEMETLRRHLEELSSMEGLCPLCKTSLNKQNREQLISNIKKDLAELLFENNKASKELDNLKKKRSDLEKIAEKYSRNIQELEKKEQIRADKNKADAELEKLGGKLSALKSEIFKIENLLTDTEKSISNFSEERNKLLESKYLYDQKERKSILEKELVKLNEEKSKHKIDPDKIKEAEEVFQTIVRRVQELRTQGEGLTNLLNEKLARLQEVEGKKGRLKKVTSDLKNLHGKAEFLDKFRTALQATQLTLRDELILTVNEVMSSVWLEIYPYSTWSGVRLSVDENDYILQIKDAEGNWVNVVGFASGGERMLAALAMRISFARVMAPGVSLLILDEPTHNLDEKAVQTLIEVLQERVSEFLDQIFVVTHEEKLAESAGNIIRLSSA